MSVDGEAAPFERDLVVDHVSYAYPDRTGHVLSDVSLTIRRGESVAFVGPTGSGKTTLIDIILGLLEPTSGAVLVDGIDITRDPGGWQRNIGVVPQALYLMDDTLRQNIVIGIPAEEIDEAQLATAIETAQLDEFIATLEDGLDTMVGERGVRISGGQRQRVAIARALYGRPSVMIFDEGTSALDSVTERDLLDAIERIRTDRTIITVAHRLATVRSCDRIYILLDGRIVDSGTYEELLERNATFKEMAR